MENRPDDRSPIARDLALFGMVVGTMLTSIGAGLGIGWWLWSHMGLPWWVIPPLAIAGLVLAMTRIVRVSKEMKK
jgi:hypothetical protein